MLALALGAPACPTAGPAGPPGPVLSIRAETLEPVVKYGAVVPVRFTVRNVGAAPCFVLRIEALAGRRWTLASLSSLESRPEGARVVRRGLLLPGQELAVTIRYRVISEDERLAIDIEIVADAAKLEALFPRERLLGLPADVGSRGLDLPSDTRFGEYTQVGQALRMPALPVPFEPGIRDMRLEAWTFCDALAGFVVRVSASNYILIGADSRSPLPPADFDFFRDLDLATEGVRVGTPAGDIDVVTRRNALPWLRHQILAGLRVVARSGDTGPEWELTR